jgi:hypothetical protein
MRKFYIFLGVVFVTIIYGCSNDVKSNNQFSEIKNNTEILLGRINDIDANVGKIESHLEDIKSNTEYSYHVIHKVNDYPNVVFFRINKSTGEIESRVNGFIDRWETYRN